MAKLKRSRQIVSVSCWRSEDKFQVSFWYSDGRFKKLVISTFCESASRLVLAVNRIKGREVLLFSQGWIVNLLKRMSI